jgi:hypothetical protein
MATKSSLQSWEIHTPRNIQPTVSYDGGSVMVWRCISHDCKLDLVAIQGNLPSVTWSRNRLSSDQWILRHVLKFQPRRAKHHAKRVRRCRSANNGRLMTLLNLSSADFRRFLTVLVDRMSFKAIGRQMGYHYTVVSRLVRKHTQTNNVKDLPRSGRPRVTSHRELAGCSLGYRLYFCVSKPSSSRRLHEAETYMDDNARPHCSRAVTAYLQKRSRDFCSLANHEPGFESHKAYLGHGRPSYSCSDCRNGVQQLVARRLWCTDHQLGCLYGD